MLGWWRHLSFVGNRATSIMQNQITATKLYRHLVIDSAKNVNTASCLCQNMHVLITKYTVCLGTQ